MELIVLMAALTLLIMLVSFFSLTREDREINREYLDLLAVEAARQNRASPSSGGMARIDQRQHAHS